MPLQSHPSDYTRAEKIAMTAAAMGIEFTPRQRPHDPLRKKMQEQLDRLNKQNRGLEHLDVYLPGRRGSGVVAQSARQLKTVTACPYCGRTGTGQVDPDGKPWHMDHVVPLSKGGEDTPSNIVKACARCNRKKSANRIFPPIGTPTGDGQTWQGADSPPLWHSWELA